jgi:glycosyltransferase involved in cell wall biosynthesis
VTFIVPCYKLAHLLPECLDSILAQTYSDFEILVMDDCSPDNTAEVAKAYEAADPRVKHVRNDPNLGHLRNYNKGIGLAQGRYVWLISADDRLRRPYALQKYVDMFELHPKVGYVFCPGFALENGVESGLLNFSVHSEKDTVFPGAEFALKLLNGNSVVAASGLVRTECYQALGMFPVDLPYAGDWYLWLLFALHYDVAYLAEPLVNYRAHPLCITNTLSARVRVADDFAVIWRALYECRKVGLRSNARLTQNHLAGRYVSHIIRPTRGDGIDMTLDECTESIRKNASSTRDEIALRSDVLTKLGDHYFWLNEFNTSVDYYKKGLQQNTLKSSLWMKYLLLRLGSAGIGFRKGLFSLRQALHGRHSEQ